MRRSEMKPEVQKALAVLDLINPSTLHVLTSANYSQRVNFESLWFNHGAQAARYSLLPYYWEGSLFILNELSSAYAG